MPLKLSAPIRSFLKATDVWRKNAFILREFKNFRKIAILALVFTLFSAVFEGFGVGFILSFLQNFTSPDAEPIKTGFNWFDVFILGVNAPVIERLYRISALILLITWLRCWFTYLGEIYTKTAQIKLVDGLRKQLFEQLQALSLRYFSKTRSGELINSLTTEIEQIKQAFEVLAFFIAKGSTLLAYVVSLLLLSWQLTIVSLMLFSLLAVGVSTLIATVREASFERSKANGMFVGTAVEFINGIRTVQAFGTQDFERRRFYEASSQIVNTVTKIVKASALVVPLSEGISITILMGMLVLAFTIFIPSGQMQPAALLTFLFVLFRLMPIVRQFNGARVRMGDFHGSVNNIRELLKRDNKPYLKNGKIPFSGLQRSIEFVSVDFGYDAEHLVLHDVNLAIEQGKTTALVGSSGAGKTTLADLIPRFYDLVGGKILIDGVDLQDFEINSVRRQMAIVSQDTFIFNTSVRNNIAYGTQEADDAAIREVARLANALEFIEEMPEGFDTLLGDRGTRLSGGQRQRIAIARALLRNPEILILDEATSALDSISERLIQESLEKLTVGRTVIAIAHRLSTIVRADKVVVLEQGRIVEQGTYQELLERRGKLWKYHQMQHESGLVS
ncbi:MAG: ABC transporter ATP-binding protein/permease [Kastovskya adunca ATA6-11-RM4]|jgi:subfamily B ATP-binding cassette protein MsbA|nr:ABC transporter ATP-binding protein/permease [Kastovskya adunca ATA6-11-RM4]